MNEIKASLFKGKITSLWETLTNEVFLSDISFKQLCYFSGMLYKGCNFTYLNTCTDTERSISINVSACDKNFAKLGPYATFKISEGVEAPSDTVCYVPSPGGLIAEYNKYKGVFCNSSLNFMAAVFSAVFEDITRSFLIDESNVCISRCGIVEDLFVLDFYYDTCKYEYSLNKKMIADCQQSKVNTKSTEVLSFLFIAWLLKYSHKLSNFSNKGPLAISSTANKIMFHVDNDINDNETYKVLSYSSAVMPKTELFRHEAQVGLVVWVIDNLEPVVGGFRL